MANSRSKHELDIIFTYETYKSIKLHFTTKYDFFKYHGKSLTKSEISSFWTSNKYGFCSKIIKKKSRVEIVEYILACMLENKNYWLSDLVEREDKWVEWTKRQEALTYNFKKDIKLFYKEPKHISWYFKSINGEYPEIVKKYARKEITPETFVLLDHVFGFLDRLKCEYESDFYLHDLLTTASKYKIFVLEYHALKNDKKRFQKIMSQVIKETENILPF